MVLLKSYVIAQRPRMMEKCAVPNDWAPCRNSDDILAEIDKTLR